MTNEQENESRKMTPEEENVEALRLTSLCLNAGYKLHITDLSVAVDHKKRVIYLSPKVQHAPSC